MELREQVTLGNGKYRLISCIGVGGQAEVWEAEQIGLEGFSRYIVLKCLTLTNDDDSALQRQSLLREARLASQLQHPNIVEIYEVGEEDNLVYLAMERIEGKDLEWMLKQSQKCFQCPLPWELVATMGIEISKALQYAHTYTTRTGEDHQIIHRDLKPSNVLLSRNGFVKVIDFGIAKPKQSRDQKDRLTLQGHIKGTPAYMSPEQIMAQPLDARSDLFALGCVLYELSTGRLPFPGDDIIQIAGAIVSTEPAPPSKWQPGLPRELERLILKLLEKKADDRFQQARHIQRELDVILRQADLYVDQEELRRFYQSLTSAKPGASTFFRFQPRGFSGPFTRFDSHTPPPASDPPAALPLSEGPAQSEHTTDELVSMLLDVDRPRAEALMAEAQKKEARLEAEDSVAFEAPSLLPSSSGRQSSVESRSQGRASSSVAIRRPPPPPPSPRFGQRSSVYSQPHAQATSKPAGWQDWRLWLAVSLWLFLLLLSIVIFRVYDIFSARAAHQRSSPATLSPSSGISPPPQKRLPRPVPPRASIGKDRGVLEAPPPSPRKGTVSP